MGCIRQRLSSSPSPSVSLQWRDSHFVGSTNATIDQWLEFSGTLKQQLLGRVYICGVISGFLCRHRRRKPKMTVTDPSQDGHPWCLTCPMCHFVGINRGACCSIFSVKCDRIRNGAFNADLNKASSRDSLFYHGKFCKFQIQFLLQFITISRSLVVVNESEHLYWYPEDRKMYRPTYSQGSGTNMSSLGNPEGMFTKQFSAKIRTFSNGFQKCSGRRGLEPFQRD